MICSQCRSSKSCKHFEVSVMVQRLANASRNATSTHKDLNHHVALSQKDVLDKDLSR